MAFRKKTLRVMSPTARKVARLIGEQESISKRLKNLIPDLQTLDAESQALKAAHNINEADKLKTEIAILRETQAYIITLGDSDITKGINDWLRGQVRGRELKQEPHFERAYHG